MPEQTGRPRVRLQESVAGKFSTLAIDGRINLSAALPIPRLTDPRSRRLVGCQMLEGADRVQDIALPLRSDALMCSVSMGMGMGVGLPWGGCFPLC